MELPPLKPSFGAINPNNINMLRKLNSVIFPVVYNDRFYSDILLTPEEFTMFGAQYLTASRIFRRV